MGQVPTPATAKITIPIQKATVELVLAGGDLYLTNDTNQEVLVKARPLVGFGQITWSHGEASDEAGTMYMPYTLTDSDNLVIHNNMLVTMAEVREQQISFWGVGNG